MGEPASCYGGVGHFCHHATLSVPIHRWSYNHLFLEVVYDSSHRSETCCYCNHPRSYISVLLLLQNGNSLFGQTPAQEETANDRGGPSGVLPFGPYCFCQFCPFSIWLPKALDLGRVFQNLWIGGQGKWKCEHGISTDTVLWISGWVSELDWNCGLCQGNLTGKSFQTPVSIPACVFAADFQVPPWRRRRWQYCQVRLVNTPPSQFLLGPYSTTFGIFLTFSLNFCLKAQKKMLVRENLGVNRHNVTPLVVTYCWNIVAWYVWTPSTILVLSPDAKLLWKLYVNFSKVQLRSGRSFLCF